MPRFHADDRWNILCKDIVVPNILPLHPIHYYKLLDVMCEKQSQIDYVSDLFIPRYNSIILWKQEIQSLPVFKPIVFKRYHWHACQHSRLKKSAMDENQVKFHINHWIGALIKANPYFIYSLLSTSRHDSPGWRHQSRGHHLLYAPSLALVHETTWTTTRQTWTLDYQEARHVGPTHY